MSQDHIENILKKEGTIYNKNWGGLYTWHYLHLLQLLKLLEVNGVSEGTKKKKFAQTIYDYTVKDSFDFAKDITQQSSKLFMPSLDVDSLFTNVPLDETIEICVNELFKSIQTVLGLNKQQVLEMLLLTTKENILFDQKY